MKACRIGCVCHTHSFQQGKACLDSSPGKILSDGDIKSLLKSAGKVFPAVKELICDLGDGSDRSVVHINIAFDLAHGFGKRFPFLNLRLLGIEDVKKLYQVRF